MVGQWPTWALGRNDSPGTALFREVNERVAEVATRYEVETLTQAVDFTCECGRIDCSETMMMTIVEYEAIRARSTHFGVVPQHEQPEIESVIERHPSYYRTGSRARSRSVAEQRQPIRTGGAEHDSRRA